MLKLTWAVLLLSSALNGCALIDEPQGPIQIDPDANKVSVCDLPFPDMREEIFLQLTPEEQKAVLQNQGNWLNECLAPGADTPASLF